jgi:hypothetical protein
MLSVKQAFTLEWSVGDRKYLFTIPDGSPYGEIYDATFAFWRKANEIKAKADEEAVKLAEDAAKKAAEPEVIPPADHEAVMD